MTVPGNATVNATDKRLGAMAYEAGKYVMDMVKKGITARDIITEEAIENAIITDTAIAGSTNLFLHIPAIAHEAGIDRDWWSFFDEMSHKVPLLTEIAPNGPYFFNDFERAGGMKALMKTLLPLLHSDCKTINGKTLAENYKDAVTYDEKVIHSLDAPISSDGGISVLKGNLAPEGAILKTAAVPENMMQFEGTARVFSEVDDALAALRSGEIKAGDAVVINYLGPKGRFGTTAFAFQKEVAGMDLYDKVAIITDGRFSGGSSGLSIGYVAPEAAIKGPLAAVRDGDRIFIDVPNRKIHIDLTDEEIADRLSKVDWKLQEEKFKPFLRLFARNVSSTAKGATWL